jgi:putative tryptophan/tyrosine transport system substrate-binding protein
MRRRDFTKGIVGSAAAWPLAARSQQSAMPVIGFLNAGSAAKWQHLVEAFRRGLSEAGYVEGKNIVIEYRWADGQWDRLPALAADLVQRGVTLIVTGGGDPPALAAKAATTTIPIVFTSGSDPVKSGLVASFGRPGGNVTGLTSLNTEIGPKRLSLLSELAHTQVIAVLVSSSDPPALVELEQLKTAAQTQRKELEVFQANSETEIDAAFEAIEARRLNAIYVGSGAYYASRRDQLVGLAAQRRIPTIYQQREFVEAGGLISYGISFIDQYRHLGLYAGQVLHGAKPAELPVQQPTKFELVVNLRTAKTLDLTIPSGVLAITDEVIE